MSFARRVTDGDVKLPVVVLVPGGAFNRGAARMHNTASMLAWSAEPFVGSYVGGIHTQRGGLLRVAVHGHVRGLHSVLRHPAAAAFSGGSAQARSTLSGPARGQVTLPRDEKHYRGVSVQTHGGSIWPLRLHMPRAANDTPRWQRGQPARLLYHWGVNMSVILGANYGDQMRYQTYNPEVRSISPAQGAIVGTMHVYISSVIVSGDPNRVPGRFSDRPRWHAFVTRKEGMSGQTIVLGISNNERAGGSHAGVLAQSNFTREECHFWWKQTENWQD
ncbi:hypothetical protein N8T08_002526 [Aspergillus melleus]|uniref:Uncharacterized protein n=1 Tax=Aspergillus melleus TaxID=138277 RepID=A0ACC3B8J1_9EURO|nr:hypothetical protein N8T08_002526 [Aspergillus melleus]